eukprot:4409977-Pyramimonas_sp.AAC.1
MGLLSPPRARTSAAFALGYKRELVKQLWPTAPRLDQGDQASQSLKPRAVERTELTKIAAR